MLWPGAPPSCVNCPATVSDKTSCRTAHLPSPPLSSLTRDAKVGIDQRLSGQPANGQDHARLNQLNMSLGKRPAEGNFTGVGFAVSWWAPEYDIGDAEILLAREPYIREHVVQHLPRSTDKRATLSILIPARGFTDDHDVTGHRTIAKNRVAGGFPQQAAVERVHRSFEFINCGTGRSAFLRLGDIGHSLKPAARVLVDRRAGWALGRRG